MTREQIDVWFLAKEILEREASAIDPATLDEMRGNKIGRGNNDLDWALSYFACLPEGDDQRMRVRDCHERDDMAVRESKRCGSAVSWFYKRLQRRRLYGEGVRMLKKIQ